LPSYSVRSATKHDTSKGASCPIAIGYALKDMYDEIQNELFYLDEVEECDEIVEVKKEISLKSKCPNCEEALTFEGGCNICKACGWSKCD
jgi:ribonucleoside-diphosphate reductase alpha chain